MLAGQLRTLLEPVVHKHLHAAVLQQLERPDVFVHASLEYAPPFTMCLVGKRRVDIDSGVARCARLLEAEGFASTANDTAGTGTAVARALRLRRFLARVANLVAWRVAPDAELQPNGRVVSAVSARLEPRTT